MKNTNRQLDLSAKFLQMGQALMKEGRENEDQMITLIGTNLIFLGGIVLSDNDVRKFSELVSMFSAKKLLDAMGGNSDLENQNSRNKSENTSYDEIINQIKKLRDDNNEN